ncbi:V-type ATP synthase subunit I [Prolixibacter sp. SD074]|uniref:V-type ATP synthase subunit I n=1 Tax=Prolixibacter sp. SD074 TaxID=2652391 RepID=UPI00188F8AA4|nr:V-type ATPase 116kDa subunit family protein [Prolixibacter sp. SD074]
MKKYTFLVYHREYETFLEAVRERGLLHVKERKGGEMDDATLREKMQLLKRISDAIKFLHLREAEPVENAGTNVDSLKVLHDFEAMRHEREVAEQEVQSLQKDLHLLEPWGDFSWESVERLAEDGWEINFFSTSSRRWEKDWPEKYNAFIISELGTTTWFVTVTPKGGKVDIDADPVRLPGHSINFVRSELKKLEDKIAEIDAAYNQYAASYLPALEQLSLKVQQEFDFDKVVLSSPRSADDKVVILEGFIPDNASEEFDHFLESQGVYFESAYPDLKEKVPVLLKNNWFTRLFETIGDLYALPNYKELDLTPYYAPFYWVFFGFCLGDAGYGLVLALIGFIMSGRVKPSMKGPMKLLGSLGLATIIFGLISGTVFGMNLYEMHFSFYGTLADRMAAQGKTINDHLFTLALLLGAIQIIFGMFIKVANEKHQFGWKYAVGTAGWLVLIVGGLLVYLMKTLGVGPLIVNIVMYVVIGVGFAGAFLFNNPERNVFTNFGVGLWDAYNMVTGVLGDLLSYIRLFALGVSSAILGYVFNSLAMQLSPDIPVLKIVVMIIILLIGHGITIFMSTLGAFVHPMRLTFVEFYKNSGFAGGGLRYTPFKKKIS